jgi:hypothetical protein
LQSQSSTYVTEIVMQGIRYEDRRPRYFSGYAP